MTWPSVTCRRVHVRDGGCWDCRRPAIPGRGRCKKHLLARQRRLREAKAARVAAGLCCVFGCNLPIAPGRPYTRPGLPRYVKCEVHLVIERVYQRERKRMLRAVGEMTPYPEPFLPLDQARFMIIGGAKFGDVYPLVAPTDRLELKNWYVHESGVPARPPSPTDLVVAARDMGYTGDVCGKCGSPRMKRTGPCSTCEACGSTDGGCG